MSSICFVVTTPFTANGFLLEHLKELSKIHQVSLCMNLGLYESSPRLASYGITIIDVPLQRKISFISDFKALGVLYKVFRLNRFDSIHSLTPKAGLLAMTAAFISGTPNRFHTFTGQVWVNYQGLSRALFKRIDWLIAQFATKVFADSPSQIEYLINQGICKATEISILGPGSISGVDLSRFKPNPRSRESVRIEYGVDSSTCVFLFVGRLCTDKGVLDLIQAYTSVAKHHQSVALWIVGPDEEQIQHHASLMTDLLTKNIAWIGPTFSPEIYMAAADILILPSYREGFGSVIIEAAACGLPAIAYRIDGVIDALTDKKTGLLCSLGNIDELQNAMILLLVDKTYRMQLGEKAHQNTITTFSSYLVTEAWCHFYSQVKTREVIQRARKKRYLDILLAIVALIILALPILVVTLFVFFSSGRPVLYWSKRVGKDNQIFEMPKFRTMRKDTPALATHLLVDPHSCLTLGGGFLRKTSLDELPQLWSILKGSMSFVGPRPALFNQIDLIEMRTNLGLQVLVPGLTGWAQVNGRDELDLVDKVKYDAQYIQKQSTLFDFYIMWLTLLKVVRREDVSH
jgi:lipopolysaccharide/colanic/teichoic acid biosynthesis glycosyltransferase